MDDAHSSALALGYRASPLKSGASGDCGVPQLLKPTVEAAAAMKAVAYRGFERYIATPMVHGKAIANPANSGLLKVARERIARLARRVCVALKAPPHERVEETLCHRAADYASAREFKGSKRLLRRQRSILPILLRETTALPHTGQDTLRVWHERPERLNIQKPHCEGKLNAFNAPQPKCIGKSKDRQPYEFGVKICVAATCQHGLKLGTHRFPCTPNDGDALAAMWEVTSTLLQEHSVSLATAVVDLTYRGVDANTASVQIVHRDSRKTLKFAQCAWLRRRQVVELNVGQLKAGRRLHRSRLPGQ